MRRHRDPAASKGPFSVTTIIGTLLYLLILSFADCSSGSCLSYGHSCWGAHGKRSNSGSSVQLRRSADAHRDRGYVAEVETDENAPAPRIQDRWILSRLITGRLTVPAPVSTAGKRRGNRWHEAQKMLESPGDWDTDYDSTRNKKFEDTDSIEDENRVGDSVYSTRRLLEPQTETAKLLLVPSGSEFDNRPSRVRRIRLFKILTDVSDDRLQ